MTNYIDKLFKGWAVERYGAAVVDKISDSEIEFVRCSTMQAFSDVAAEFIKNGKDFEDLKETLSIKESFLEFLAVCYFPELL